MKMPWNRENVRILPAKIDLSQQPWCREALLLNSVLQPGKTAVEGFPQGVQFRAIRCIQPSGGHGWI